jgi:hypothetical protein
VAGFFMRGGMGGMANEHLKTWEMDDDWQGTEREFVRQQYNDAVTGDFYPPGERGNVHWDKDWTLPIICCVLSGLVVVFAVVMEAIRE